MKVLVTIKRVVDYWPQGTFASKVVIEGDGVQAAETLRTALAMGADRGILVKVSQSSITLPQTRSPTFEVAESRRAKRVEDYLF